MQTRPKRVNRVLGSLLAMTVGALSLAGSCSGPQIGILQPAAGQLSMTGGVTVQATLLASPDPGTLSVTLDGVDATASLSLTGRYLSGSLAVPSPGGHELVVEGLFGGEPWSDRRSFETVVLTNASECEVLNDTACLLPYPSSRFLVPAPTATGVRLQLPQAGMPSVTDPPVSPQPFNELDGFSPGVQILMHFPQGVDPELSGASRLLPPGCCEQPAGPPWVRTRTYDGRSLDEDSPTVLLDAESGDRIVHFIEPDAYSPNDPARRVLYMRPGRGLAPGHRYIVAMRRLVDPSGVPVQPEPVFAAIRDRRPTTISAVEERARHLDEAVFPVLTEHGVGRENLVLAFDFVVQSDHQLTHQAIEMRNQAYAWLAQVENDPNGIPFTVDSVVENDCTAPPERTWREVTGTFESPLFLTGAPSNFAWVQLANVDANDVPVQNGFVSRPFTVGIPCAVLDPSARTPQPILLGPGGAQGSGIAADFNQWAGIGGDQASYVAGATDWQVQSSENGFHFVLNSIGFVVSRLDNAPAVPDRIRQEVLDALVLGRMMKRGLFNRDPAFRTPDGRDVFPGPGEDLLYWGVSLGAGYGLMLSALSPDIDRLVAANPATHFPWMFRRNEAWNQLAGFWDSIGLTDPMELAIWMGLWHELWVSADATGYLEHVTREPLPGAGEPKAVLMPASWLDRSVPNLGTETAARTLGIPNVAGSAMRQMVQIPEADEPTASGLAFYDSGFYDLFDPAFASATPPLTNLAPSPSQSLACDPHQHFPRALEFQYFRFLQPDGRVESFCEGTCDAGSVIEEYFLGCSVLGATPVVLANGTTELLVHGGDWNNGLISEHGYFRYRDLASGLFPAISIDPLILFPDGAVVNLSNGAKGGFGSPVDRGAGVVRSIAMVGGISIEADTELVGRTAITTFHLTSTEPMDGIDFVFSKDSSIGIFDDDVAGFSGAVETGDLEIFQSESPAGGLTVRLAGLALSGAQLRLFGSGTFPYFGLALEGEGDLSVLSADGSNFQTSGVGGVTTALGFSLSGNAATIAVEYGVVP